MSVGSSVHVLAHSLTGVDPRCRFATLGRGPDNSSPGRFLAIVGITGGVERASLGVGSPGVFTGGLLFRYFDFSGGRTRSVCGLCPGVSRQSQDIG